MANATLRVALIGAGTMGSLHARVISQSGRAVLSRVVDRSEAAGQAVTTKYGGRWTPEIGDLDDVDAVVVAAPTDLHATFATAALEAGKPLLLEKPVATTMEESQLVVDTAAKNDVPLMCGFVERFNPAVLTATRIVREPLHLTSMRHGPYAPRIRTGVAWDLLIHDIDSCLRLVGREPARVSGSIGRFHPTSLPEAEDVSDAVIEFTGFAVATVSASRLGHRKVRSMTITELDRVIDVDLLRRDVTIYRHVAHQASTDDGAGYRQQTIIEIPEVVSNREPLAAQWDHFCALIDGDVDATQERESILPPHQVVAWLCGAEARPQPV